jgi:hypothetical protein
MQVSARMDLYDYPVSTILPFSASRQRSAPIELRAEPERRSAVLERGSPSQLPEQVPVSPIAVREPGLTEQERTA